VNLDAGSLAFKTQPSEMQVGEKLFFVLRYAKAEPPNVTDCPRINVKNGICFTNGNIHADKQIKVQ
jgi:hypothetical protein